MKNLKTTLVSLAALSAAAFASYAQEQQAPAAPAEAPAAAAVEAAAPAAQPQAKTSKIKTKYGEIEISSSVAEDGSEKISAKTPALPKDFNSADLLNTLVACSLGVVENASAQDVLKAFAASMSTVDLSAASGAPVVLTTTIPQSNKSSVELTSKSATFVFTPEVTTAGDVKGSIVATDSRGNTSETSVDVTVSDSGVTGKVGGSNVSVSAASVSVSQPGADSVEVPTAAEATTSA
ncbi:MAG: hypothetical protein J6T16_02370, partial [Opitutales bacterium]|nr:hypothetical protein [Opitutales bacterium]